MRQYVGFEFAWDLRLILERDDVPSLDARRRDRRIGRLGRTAWLKGGRYRRTADADDLVMNVESIRLRDAAPRLSGAP